MHHSETKLELEWPPPRMGRRASNLFSSRTLPPARVRVSPPPLAAHTGRTRHPRAPPPTVVGTFAPARCSRLGTP
eukprot:scaffold31507_cov101-Isochrysis_galbana.AAC.2